MIATILGISSGVFLIVLGLASIFFNKFIYKIFSTITHLIYILFYRILHLDFPFVTDIFYAINNFYIKFGRIIGIILIGIGVYLGGLGFKLW